MNIATALEESALSSTAPAPHCALPLTIKVLTLNTHKGFTTFNRRFVLHELREAIRSVGADVVFLQEVLGDDSAARPPGVNWPSVPQYEFLADTLWPHFSYGRNAAYPQGHHGNAVLSRFPILSFRNTDISIAGPERRGMLHCVLGLPGWTHNVHVICVHLGLVAKHRIQQVHLLCGLIGNLPTDEPLILAGDFNDWQQHAGSILGRRAGLVEAFAATQGRPARTFPAWWPLLRLDRIYCRNATALNPQVLSRTPWSRLSDHAGLFAEIRL